MKVGRGSYFAKAAGLLITVLASLNIRPCEALSSERDGRSVFREQYRFELAQLPDPNRERFLQPTPDIPTPLPQEEEPLLPNRPIESTPLPLEQPNFSIEVKEIHVVGSTIFERSDFDSILQELESGTVTLAELSNAADEITQLYLDRGYITSRAVLPPQEVVDGVVEIQVVEGSLEAIEIEGASRLGGYTRRRIRVGASAPLQVGALEDRLLLLQSDPRIENITASLQPGDSLGQSKLLVSLEEGFPFQSNLSFDNFSIPSVGSLRLGVGISHLNVFGIGDTFSAAFFRTTTGDSNVIDISYTIPVNPQDGTVQLRALLQRDDASTDFDGFTQTTEADSDRYTISYRQPLFRSIREELALSIGFSYRDGSTLFSFPGFPTIPGPDEDTSVFQFGQDYLRRDLQGVWSIRSQFNFGTSLFDATTEAEPFADGQFFSWLGQFQRVQLIGEQHLVIIQSDLQLTPDSLLPSEQFVIGGGQSVRGFRQSALSGDNGIRFSIEDRITLVRDNGRPAFQLIPFFDLGAVWNNSDNPDLEDDFIASLGLGFLWQPIEGIAVRFDYGFPFIDLDFLDDSLQDDGIHFSFVIQPESFR